MGRKFERGKKSSHGQPGGGRKGKGQQRRALKRDMVGDPETREDDVFEVEDVYAEEDVLAGTKYDRVDNYEYELPEDFEDEEIDEDEAFNSEDERMYGHLFGSKDDESESSQSSDEDALDALDSEEEDATEGDDDEIEEWPHEEDLLNESGGYAGESDQISSEDDEQVGHGLQEQDEKEDRVGGLGTRGKRATIVMNEAFPESIFNLPQGEDGLSVGDLLAGLGSSRAKLGPARKSLEKLDKKARALDAPLPGPIQERLERKAAYDESKKDIQKWMPLVKAHREAPTLRLTNDKGVVQKTQTIAAVASKHKPENKMESEVAALLEAAGATTATAITESENALAVKTLSVEEAKARRDQLAKMRALLFYHEIKAKRMKKIKSKEYRRRLKKAEKSKVHANGDDMLLLDEDDLRREREDAEYQRAKERLTLKHKNTSRFIRRAIKRGSTHAPDEATREAIAEQLRLGEEIRRKIDSIPGARTRDSDDSSSSSEDEDSDEERRHARAARKLESAAKDIMEDDGPVAEKGLLALPFMKRSLEKKRQLAISEAENMLSPDQEVVATTSGRKSFGGREQQESRHRREVAELVLDSSDEEEDLEAKEKRISRVLAKRIGRDDVGDGEPAVSPEHQIPMNIGLVPSAVLPKKQTHVSIAGMAVNNMIDLKGNQKALQQDADGSFIQSNKFVGAKDGYLFTKGPKGIGYYADQDQAGSVDQETTRTKSQKKKKKSSAASDISDGLTPSNGTAVTSFNDQEELIRKAFAGDDVVEEFRKSKQEEVEEELPKEEVAGQLPGWGTWATSKREPKWLVEAKAKAKAKRDNVAKSRQDKDLKFVTISEKWDTRSSKYKTPSVPYPFDSKETYERAMRQPLGKDFNTSEAFRDLTRPSVVKDSGVIIQPLKFNASVGKQNASHESSKRPGVLTVTGGMPRRAKKVKN